MQSLNYNHDCMIVLKYTKMKLQIFLLGLEWILFLLSGYSFTIMVRYPDNCSTHSWRLCNNITSPFFAIINCNRWCLYKQHWCFCRSFCHSTSQKMLVKQSKILTLTAILLQFQFPLFGFCTCANIKRIHGYKETEPDVQFAHNYNSHQ